MMDNQPQALAQHLNAFSDELQNLLDAKNTEYQKLVQKGMLLFRQELVYGIKISHDRVEANVQDVTPVQVEFSLQQPAQYTCSCPEEGICRHQIALFFKLYSRYQSVFLWMQEWKARWNVQDVLSTLQRGSDLLKKTTTSIKSGPEQWVERIQQAYDPDAVRYFYPIDDWAYTSFRRLLTSAPVEREWKHLYHLFAAYESLKVANSIANDTIKQNVLKSFANKMAEEAEDACLSVTATASPFAFDPYFAYLRKDCQTLLEVETHFADEYLDMYGILWTFLFKNRRDRMKEWGRLRDDSSSNSRKKIAVILLAILLEEDEFALKEITRLHNDEGLYALSWLKLLQMEKSTSRLNVYLPKLLEKLSEFIQGLTSNLERNQFTRVLFQTLDRHTLAALDTGYLEKMYRQFLPFSRFYYNEYLLTKRDYQKWAELQVYLKNSIEHIDKQTISVIEKENPAVLKPLYHFAINEYINQRNRDSYKRAVRYLKRLKRLYIKEKKGNQWEHYFHVLMEKTKRLRAFQEECRKGKLINEE